MTAVPSQEVEVQITSPCFLNFLDEIAKKIHEFEASAICYRLQSAPNYSVSILVERTAWCRAQNEHGAISFDFNCEHCYLSFSQSPTLAPNFIRWV